MAKTWSEQQKAIFQWFLVGIGNLVIRARAGTGKTTTIIEAVLNWAREAKQLGGKILVAAFNKRIARELVERLGGWNRNSPVEAKTLHGLGFQFVKYAWGKDIEPNDEVEADRVSKACGLQAPEGIFGLCLKLVARVKNAAPFANAAQIAQIADNLDLYPTPEHEREGWNIDRLVKAVLAVLEASKLPRADKRISFDDQVWLPVVCRMARPWFHMVVIDEAQDMNASQLLLAQAACKRGGRIVIVGDDRQAIYGFRGADSGSIDRLKKELNATELGLTITYRCGKSIVARAAELVPDFQAHESAPEGIIDALAYEKLAETGRPGDFVLSRKNAPLMSTCLRFLRAGIPARIEGRDVGKGLAAAIKKFKARSVPDFIKRLEAWKLREDARAQRRTKDVEAALQVVADQYETLFALADGAANVDEIVQRCYNLFEDSIDPKTGKKNLKPAVVLSSVHKAKGLESDRVFILEDTLLRKRPDLEERNIEYVAITRARHHLTWVKGLPGVKAPEAK